MAIQHDGASSSSNRGRRRSPQQDGQRPERKPLETPEDFLALGEKDFYNLVDRDIRDRIDPKLALLLRESPVVIERWYQTLLRMKKMVEGTIAAKTAETRSFRIELEQFGTLTTGHPDHPNVEHFIEPKDEIARIHIEFLKWRAGSIRFKVGVEERLTEVAWRRKMVVANLVLSVAQVERNALAAEVTRLSDAILTHHNEIDSEDATEQDEALWASVPEQPTPESWEEVFSPPLV